MRAREIERYKKRLTAKRIELLDRVRQAQDTEVTVGEEKAADLGDRALSSTSRTVLHQLSASERGILRRIDKALERIDEGAYGTCLNCSQPIQKGRLDAVPWARFCIECQERLDRGEIEDLDP
ncbi:MAG: TraR/DksA family transcriptional regulator [Acidobacteria bacterium]|nr:TraR/DksA family transcriptional regulator [Acidobacteriota bacterium]